MAIPAVAATPDAAGLPAPLTLEEHVFPELVAPPLPDPDLLPIQLLLDDDSAEAVFGILGTTAREFLWFNRFDNPGPFSLRQIWVLFPDGTDVSDGSAVELAVFLDADGDPSNGAQLIATYDDTVQATDGMTFSVFELDPALDILDDGDLLIGVVNRYFSPVSDPPPLSTLPAAVDTSSSQGRSYFALWAGDAPADLDLTTATTIGTLNGPAAGNFMIRAFGTTLPVVDIPTLGNVGFLALVALLALGGWMLVRRQS